MQDDWAFCSRDLAATGPVLRPVGSGSDFVFADRYIGYPLPNASQAALISHAISMKARDCSGPGSRLILLRKALTLRHFYF
jgi:hypothetical protein